MMAGVVEITGTISVPADQIEEFNAVLSQHKKLSRADAGCLEFHVTPSSDDPCVYNVFERFADQSNFEAHKARVKASEWWVFTQNFERNYTVTIAAI